MVRRCFLFVLRRRHPALPLEELPEGRLVAEAQHLGHLLHGEGRVTQADFGFTDKQGHQDAARRALVLVLPVEGVPHLVLPGAGQGLQLFAELSMKKPCSAITEVLCIDEGAPVRKGQTLFVIDQVPYRAALQTAEANVKSAEASVATARMTADSKETLYNNKVVSAFDLQTAKNALLEAEAALAQAKAQETSARNDLSYTAYAHKGKIDAISGTIDTSTGAVSLRATFPNPEGMLRNGGSATVVVPYRRDSVLVVPQEATYEIQDRVFVYKVVDGKATSTQVSVFPVNDGQEYIVESGLQAGDVIVAEGAGLLQEGTLITD